MLNGLGVARVEIVRRGLSIVEVAGVLGPDGNVVRCAVEQIAGRLLVVAVDEEDRGCAAKDAEIGALDGVTRLDLGLRDRPGIRLVDRIDAEVVAAGQIKIGPVARHGRHRPSIECGVELRVGPFGVRVPLHTEDKRAARRPLRHERILRARVEVCRRGRAKSYAIVVARVRHETGDRHLPREIRRQRDRRGLAGVDSGLQAKLQIERVRRWCEDVGHDGLVGWPAQHERSRKIRRARRQGQARPHDDRTPHRPRPRHGAQAAERIVYFRYHDWKYLRFMPPATTAGAQATRSCIAAESCGRGSIEFSPFQATVASPPQSRGSSRPRRSAPRSRGQRGPGG